jgi:hypothetical protein
MGPFPHYPSKGTFPYSATRRHLDLDPDAKKSRKLPLHVVPSEVMRRLRLPLRFSPPLTASVSSEQAHLPEHLRIRILSISVYKFNIVSCIEKDILACSDTTCYPSVFQ